MKFIFVTLLMMVGGLAMAETTHQVTATVDGIYYQCTNGVGPADPACIQNVSTFCNSNSTYDETTCYSKATTACQVAPSQYSACVSDTAGYCDSSTPMDENSCFDSAVASCHGNSKAITGLMKQAANGPKK